MKSCPKCNKGLDDEALFCTKCGAIQKHICTACGAELVEDSNFCIKCGKAVNNENILQMQNTSEPSEKVSNISKKSFNYVKTTIVVIILAVISLIGYFTIYGSDRNYVKLILDRGVSVKIPKNWEITSINTINAERPERENLLHAINLNNNDYFIFYISSDNEDNIFTYEKLKDISKVALDELSTNFEPLESSEGIKIKYQTKLLKTPQNILRYPSVYSYHTLSMFGRENWISYYWRVAAHNQTLTVSLLYDMDTYPNNELFETIVKVVLPSIIVK